MSLSKARIVVTGGAGFLGRVVMRKLAERGAKNAVAIRSADYDLVQPDQVARMYAELKPELVLHLAAEVGGIGANRDNPGRFFYANMAMGLHLIEQARLAGVQKFVQVGTICAYPKLAPVPFREEDLWNGYPEETNAPYGVAKKALLVMLQAYRQQYGMNGVYVLPVNLYGPGDNFDLDTSHVIPALIRKCMEAMISGVDHITCWGTGSVTREFLYVDDAAEGILLAAERYDEPDPINLGTGEEISIRSLADRIARLIGFRGEIRWDPSKPDGQPRRRLQVTRARERLGFEAQTDLNDGLRHTIAWYRGTLMK